MANDNSSRAGGSKRIRFNFWLDLGKLIDNEIVELITTLKEQRLFTQTIRDGVRLICDLRAGNLTVLFSLFPWVRAEFMEYISEFQLVEAEKSSQRAHTQHENTSQQDQSSSDNKQIEAERAWLEAEQERMEQERAWEQRRIEEAQQALEAERQAIEQERQRIEAERQQSQSAIQKQLARIEDFLLQQGNVPIQSTSEPHNPPDSSASRRRPIGSPGDGLQPITLNKPQNSSRPQTLNVPQFSTPIFDDEEEDTLLEVKRDKAAGDIAVQNFLKSAMGLQENLQ